MMTNEKSLAKAIADIIKNEHRFIISPEVITLIEAAICDGITGRHDGRSAPVHNWPIKGVRVEGNAVIITARGGNEAARNLCGEILSLKHAEVMR